MPDHDIYDNYGHKTGELREAHGGDYTLSESTPPLPFRLWHVLFFSVLWFVPEWVIWRGYHRCAVAWGGNDSNGGGDLIAGAVVVVVGLALALFVVNMALTLDTGPASSPTKPPPGISLWSLVGSIIPGILAIVFFGPHLHW